MKKKSDKWKVISVLSAFVFSLFAFSLSLYESCEQRKHRILMVKPLLTIKRIKDLNANHLGIYLINTGLGPAVINEVILLIDDEKIEAKKLEKILGLEKIIFRYSTISKNYVLMQGESIPIIEVDNINLNIQQKLKFKNEILKIGIKVIFESIYEKRYHVYFPAKKIRKRL